MQISEERKKLVIDLYFNQHKTYAEIAQMERISPRDIHAIIKEEEAKLQKYKDQQQQEERSSKAYKLFCEKKSPVEVAIALNLGQPDATKLYREYWELKRLHVLNSIFKETNGKLGMFLKLYRLIKEKGMSIDQVVNAVEIAIHKLPYMENLYGQAKDQAEKMQRTRQGLVNDIEERKKQISLLDNIIFSSEEDCKRKEQQIRELGDKKNRIEKVIANILNGEDYSKLMQIIKENVKVVLSENKKLISISFVALIQTIKTDLQMVKLIQNIPSANDGKYEDNNNIIKYLESNKDSLLYLTEKHYENLVEAFTKNAIHIAASASSSLNPTLSLPQQSSAFPNLSTQSDKHRKEDPETYNSKGDIID
jgi:predicted DNA-binding protein YlxM (UPF0122 family)